MASLTFEEREEQTRQMSAFLRNGPYEPLVTAAEVLEASCATCGAEAGAPCDFSRWTFSLLGFAFPGFGNFHTRRYQDVARDPR